MGALLQAPGDMASAGTQWLRRGCPVGSEWLGGGQRPSRRQSTCGASALSLPSHHRAPDSRPELSAGLPQLRPPKGSPRGPWAQHFRETLAPDLASSIPHGWPGPPSTPASTAAKMHTLPPTCKQRAPTHLLSANPKGPSLQSSPARSPRATTANSASPKAGLSILPFSPHSLTPFPQ